MIPVKDVRVSVRFRKKFEDMDKLATSIAQHGQIEPIVLDEDNNLIAGERRLKAHQMLKKEEIGYVVISNLSEVEKKEIEIEENIQRKAFTWQEEVQAKKDLHELKVAKHGTAIKGHESEGWKLKDTAESLCEAVGTTSMDLQLAEGMKYFPELAEETSKTTAFKKMKALKEKLLQSQLAERLKSTGLLDCPDIIHGDCIVKMREMRDETVDLVLTDPPYGIDIDKAKNFDEDSGQQMYKDDEHYAINLMDKAFAEYYRLLKPNRHAVIFCGIDKFYQLSDLLKKQGFEVWKFPIIWDKSSGGYAGQKTSFTHSYEVFIHATKGKRNMTGDHRDVYTVKRVPSEFKIHPSEKPAELIRDLIKLLSMPAEMVLDSFGGSGVVAEAARDTGRQCKVIELDATFHKNIIERLGK